MNLNLAGKHLVVVGFWSDWGYLNDVFATALTLRNAASVTVVNPGKREDLERKAPLLWDTLKRLSEASYMWRPMQKPFLTNFVRLFRKFGSGAF